MVEKTVNASQRIILLRSRCVAIALCLVLLFCPMALSVGALGVDYKDLDYQVSVDGDNNIVTLTIPEKYTRMQVRQGGSYVVNKGDTHSVSWVANSGIYLIRIYPFYDGGLSLDDIPAGSTLTFDITMNPSGGYNTPTATASWTYLDSSLGEVGWGSKDFGYAPIADTFSFEIPIQRISGAVSLNPLLYFNNFSVLEPNTSVTVTVESAVLTMSISSLYFMQQQTGKTNEILTEVEKQLEANGQTLQEVLDAQQQTNDKLDQLPGQIGDEMQDIIDSEKEESKNEGNQFVDQILDALPDPSAEVLRAMKSLTDATSYTGTDAVLPIPAIVLPGIDGLFPETVIWGGDSFDFGEYMEMLPPALLTLIQSLFTIAIVLFCVYELKGIIDYCLILRDKGGN